MSFHIKIESIHFLRICILTSLLAVPYQVRAQEYFQMRCIGVDVYNKDSMKIAKENVGKIIKISSNVKSSYYNRNKEERYYIGGNFYPRRKSQTIFENLGIDYWCVYDRAIFSEDYLCLDIIICRPLGRQTHYGAKCKKITLHYRTTNLTKK